MYIIWSTDYLNLSRYKFTSYPVPFGTHRHWRLGTSPSQSWPDSWARQKSLLSVPNRRLVKDMIGLYWIYHDDYWIICSQKCWTMLYPMIYWIFLGKPGTIWNRSQTSKICWKIIQDSVGQARQAKCHLIMSYHFIYYILYYMGMFLRNAMIWTVLESWWIWVTVVGPTFGQIRFSLCTAVRDGECPATLSEWFVHRSQVDGDGWFSDFSNCVQQIIRTVVDQEFGLDMTWQRLGTNW